MRRRDAIAQALAVPAECHSATQQIANLRYGVCDGVGGRCCGLTGCVAAPGDGRCPLVVGLIERWKKM